MPVWSTYANDALGPDELDERVSNGTLGVALAVRLDVAEITDVADLVGGSAVGLAVGVDYACQTRSSNSSELMRLTVRTGRGAAVGVVAKCVNVEAALGVGVVTGDVVGNGRGSRLGGLLEDDGPGDLGVAADDTNWQCQWLIKLPMAIKVSRPWMEIGPHPAIKVDRQETRSNPLSGGLKGVDGEN